MDMPVCKARAAATRAEAPREGAEERRQYLVFTLGRETYALDTHGVREILPFTGLAEVPLLPECIRGVISVRETMVPVFDLGVRFGRGPTAAARRTCIVVVELQCCGAQLVLGILVDAVNEVREIGASAIEPAPTFGRTDGRDLLAGVAKVGGSFIILLDTSHALSVEDFQALAADVAD
jgi:purine-binding chemotaxis protein CheW